MRSRRLSSLAALSGLILGAVAAPMPALGASSIVECGQVSAYTAPDPVAPTDGTFQMGTLPAWDILATATVGPNAAATLASLVNSGPTCVALDLDDDDAITSLEFAAEGAIEGTVDFDSGSEFFIFADRLIIPAVLTDAYPGLGALFATSHAAGTPLRVSFDVDPTTGQFLGFDGTAAFCGTGSVTPDGDGRVGDAVIPAAILDAGDVAALADAGTRTTCASIHSVGTIDPNSGDIAITADVVIDVAAAPATPAPAGVTPPPTDVSPARAASGTTSDVSGLAWLLIGIAATGAALVRRHRPTRA